jgi:SSS family solute:Na+ symporter
VQRLSGIDLTVLVAYLVAVVGLGAWFVRRNRTTRDFMAAGGSLPGWAVGLSIFGTYLSSNTFIGVPGKAYGGNWNGFVFSLSLPLAAWVAVKWFVPFYRRTGEISAYHHLEKRFGPWARTYTLTCYLLTQLARVGAILFGVALGLNALTGWSMLAIIIMAGVAVTLYTLLGGIEAVIWTDVMQSIVLLVGAVAIAVLLLVNHPGGASEAIHLANNADKFSVGSFAVDFTQSTFWVMLLYGIFINLNNLGIDQSFVQRYHAARDEREAKRSVWLGALLYVPVAALFFFIGSMLFSHYEADVKNPDGIHQVREVKAEENLVEQKNIPKKTAPITTLATNLEHSHFGDKVLPHFIAKLPQGVAGLLIAAIFAAAMSSIDTSLNSAATVTLKDFAQRYLNYGTDEVSSMKVLRGATLVWGVLGTGVALAMIGQKSLLDTWWKVSGIFAGGMLGIFLLGLIGQKARNAAAVTGVVIGVMVIFWMTFSPGWGAHSGTVTIYRNSTMIQGYKTKFTEQIKTGDKVVIKEKTRTVKSVLSDTEMVLDKSVSEKTQLDIRLFNPRGAHQYRNLLHANMIAVVGTLTIFLVGLGVSWLRRKTDFFLSGPDDRCPR